MSFFGEISFACYRVQHPLRIFRDLLLRRHHTWKTVSADPCSLSKFILANYYQRLASSYFLYLNVMDIMMIIFELGQRDWRLFSGRILHPPFFVSNIFHHVGSFPFVVRQIPRSVITISCLYVPASRATTSPSLFLPCNYLCHMNQCNPWDSIYRLR